MPKNSRILEQNPTVMGKTIIFIFLACFTEYALMPRCKTSVRTPSREGSSLGDLWRAEFWDKILTLNWKITKKLAKLQKPRFH